MLTAEWWLKMEAAEETVEIKVLKGTEIAIKCYFKIKLSEVEDSV